ncbi:hypothetical protein CISIN_1g0086013mg, partial [Citrus sinensis]
MKYLLYE